MFRIFYEILLRDKLLSKSGFINNIFKGIESYNGGFLKHFSRQQLSKSGFIRNIFNGIQSYNRRFLKYFFKKLKGESSFQNPRL